MLQLSQKHRIFLLDCGITKTQHPSIVTHGLRTRNIDIIYIYTYNGYSTQKCVMEILIFL